MRFLPGMALFGGYCPTLVLSRRLTGGKAYLHANLFMHTAEGYSKGWTHPRPLYYYFYIFPG